MQSIIIGEGADAVTISGPMLEFDIRTEQQYNAAGYVESVEWVIDVESDVVGAAASNVYDGAVDLSKEVVEKFNNRRVQIQLDGVTKFDLEPDDGWLGPLVQDFQTIREEGAGESHWRCSFTIIFRAKGGNDPSDGYNMQSSITVEREINGAPFRKTWTVSVQSKTTERALAIVKALKPPVINVQERIERHLQEARAAGVWVWEAENPEGLSRIFCSIETASGGGKDYVVDKQAGVDAAPNLHRARRNPAIITVRGYTIGKTRSLARPPAHFSESENLKRLTDRETQHNTEIHSVEKGEYRLDWEEVWIAVGQTPGANHNGHDSIDFTHPNNAEPSDGPMAVN